MKIITDPGNGGYTGSVISYVNKMIKDYAAGRPMTEEIANQIRAEQKDEYLCAKSPKPEKFMAEIDKYMPALRITDEKQIEARTKIKDDLSRKMFKIYLNRDIELDKEPRVTNRHLQALVLPGPDEASLAKNDRFRNVMAHGTEKEKHDIIADRLEAIGNMDLSLPEMYDDKAFVENYEKIYLIGNMTDVTNLIRIAEENNVDLTEPRFERFVKNCPSMSSIWDYIGRKTEAIVSPVYPELDYEKFDAETNEAVDNIDIQYCVSSSKAMLNYSKVLSGHEFYKPLFVLLDKDTPLGERLEKANKMIGDDLNIVKPFNDRKAMSYPDDKKLRKVLNDFDDNRLHTQLYAACDDLLRMSDKDYADTQYKRVAKVIATYEKLVDYQTGSSVPNAFTPEAIAKATEKMANNPVFKQMFDTISYKDIYAMGRGEMDRLSYVGNTILQQIVRTNKLQKSGIVCGPGEINQEPIPDKETNPKAFYLHKLNENIKIVQEYDSSFTMSEQEKEALLTPERIAFHERAKAIHESRYYYDNKLANENFEGSFDHGFERIHYFILKRGDSLEDKAYNDKLFTVFNTATAEGDAMRKEVFVDFLNKINEIDPEMFTEAHTTQEQFDYVCEHYDAFQIAFELPHIMSDIDASGFNFSPEGKQKYQDQKDYLANIAQCGMQLVNLAEKDGYLTFPVDKLRRRLADNDPDAQRTLIAMSDDHNTAISKSMDSVFNLHANASVQVDSIAAKDTQNGKKQYTVNDLVDTVPLEERVIDSIPNLKDKFSKALSDLKKADNFYNFRNSDQYKAMLTSLQSSIDVMSNIKSEPTAQQQKSLRDSIQDVRNASLEYIKYAKGLEKNANRQARFDIAKRVKNYTILVVDDVSIHHTPLTVETDKRFARFIKNNNEKAMNKLADKFYARENVSTAEAMFNQGVEKTNAERAKIDTLPEGSTARNAQKILVEARDELTNLVGRKETNPASVRLLMAKVVTCSQLVNGDNLPLLSEQAINTAAATVATNNNFIALTKKTDSTAINKFLGANGAEELANKYSAYLNAGRNRQQANHVVENPAVENPELV